MMTTDQAIVADMVRTFLHHDPIIDDKPIPGHDTDEDQERCPSCGDALTASGPAVCAACAEGGVCTVCAGPHYAYRCPEIAAARRADAPNPGRAIARQWHRDTRRFIEVLRQLDRAAWLPLAQAYIAYIGLGNRVETVLTAWTMAVDGTTHLPAKAAA